VKWIVLVVLAACGSTGPEVVRDNQSGVERAHLVGDDPSGCYDVCPVGSTCNDHTHECEPGNACGHCGAGQVCDSSGPVPACVSPDAGAPRP